jgi:pectate lyase
LLKGSIVTLQGAFIAATRDSMRAGCVATVLLCLSGCGVTDLPPEPLQTQTSRTEPVQEVPAFPGAEGWGAKALNGCRALPLKVHQVTNVEDRGPGSLRDAIEAVRSDRYDVILFRTGGTIAVEESQILLSEGCVYVAGQTAAGDGILIRSHPTNGVDGHLVRVNATTSGRDVVFRYLRLRHGEEGGVAGGGLGLIGSGGANDIVFDHISTTWGGGSAHLQLQRNDQNAEETERLTIQNSLVAEGFQNRAVMIYGGTGGSARGFRNISMHRNLMAVVGHRHPRIHVGDAAFSTTDGVEVVNNLMFGATNRYGEAHRRSVVDWVGNYVDHGPHHQWRISRWEGEFVEDEYQALDPGDPGSLYVAGNAIEGFDGPDFESWRDRHDGESLLPTSFKRSARLSQPPFPIREMTAATARRWILVDAGASRRIDCQGRWVPNRDEVDDRIVTYVRSRSPSATPEDAFGMTVAEIHGGWPTMDPGTPCMDSDGDGLPDEWEERFFGCATCADPEVITASGYLVMEHYLNGTAPNWSIRR